MICPHAFALLFGEYPDLHWRLLDGLARTLPPEVPVTIWCNQVCAQTRELLGKFERFKAIFSNENVPKYLVMRQLFKPLKERPDCNWIIWFDDDTHIVANDWYTRTAALLSSASSHVYLGQAWCVPHLPGQAEFIRAARWYRNRPFEVSHGRPGITFAQGSYWWLRTDMLARLDWPDERLSHNGGDSLLAEAVRQQGPSFTLTRFSYGVKPNDAKRRGLSEKPAGSLIDCRR